MMMTIRKMDLKSSIVSKLPTRKYYIRRSNGTALPSGPLLPLDAFHGIMAALLMNEASTVSAVAQEAIVRFIQLLEDRNVKPTETTENVEDALDTPRASEEGKRTHIHQHYDLPERARLLIRDDLIDNIVLALFQLENKPAAFATLWKDESNQRPNLTLHDVRPVS